MARTLIHSYISYNFVDKDPEVDRLRTVVGNTPYAIVSACSGVSETTLRNWFLGKTRKPQNASIEAVGRAMGMKREWVPMTGAEGKRALDRKAREFVKRGKKVKKKPKKSK